MRPGWQKLLPERARKTAAPLHVEAPIRSSAAGVARSYAANTVSRSLATLLRFSAASA
jgi:hypothetical protein